MDRVFALSIHADYQCRHSGVCCTSDWDVPIELPVYRNLDEAMKAGALHATAPAADGEPALVTSGELPEDAAAMVSRTSRGDCVFYHRGSGLCVIHRDLGESSLPYTCRDFPRLAVRGTRGISISLTHYCPTAAASLFRDDVPIEIVAGPSAFPPAEYEGLVIEADDWPPLLHPRMLMDLDGYSAWERHMVSRCADPCASPETIIATLERDARILRTYAPGRDQSLAAAVTSLPGPPVPGHAHATLERSLGMFEEVVRAIPEDMKPSPDEESLPEAFVSAVAPEWHAWHAPLRRYLAAKAFANWTAYQGRGILSIVRGLDAALALVRVEAARQCRNAGRALDGDLLREAIRRADFLLNHLAVGDELADIWSAAEA
jgi:Fe-S-cluster containining protein